MASPRVSSVSAAAELGQAPHWLSRSNCLLYVDYSGREVRRLRPADKPGEAVLKLDKKVSFAIPVEGRENQFLVGQERDIALLTWDGHGALPGGLEVLATVDADSGKELHRLGDAKVDPRDRLWTGTRSRSRSRSPSDREAERGAVYSLSGGRQLRRHLDEASTGSGLAWSPDGATCFHVDSFARRVDAFDFHLEEGEISNRRVVFDFEAKNVKGFPNGMATDAEGKLWVACYGGSQVVRVDPATGTLMKALPIPWRDVTSVAFGGDRLQDLYVTTCSRRLAPGERAAFPGAGTTFRATELGVSGLPARQVALS